MKLTRTDAGWLIVIVLTAWWAVYPVLLDPRACILDCPSFFQAAERVCWYDPSTYVWKMHPTRSAYGMMLYLFPIYIIPSVALRFWIHTGALLALTHSLIYLLVLHVTQRRWSAVGAAVLSLFHISFAENYYTMFKGEPWVLAGIMVITYMMWRATQQDRTVMGGIVWGIVAAAAALAVYGIKETGIAFLPVYLAGLWLVAWGEHMPIQTVARRMWWVTCCNVICGAILVWNYVHLPITFGTGSTEAYVVTTDNIVNGTWRLARYFWMTSPHVYGAGVLTLLTIWRYKRYSDDAALRRRGAWLLYCALLCCSLNAILIAWTAISPRYYLAGAAVSMVWAVVAIEGAWSAYRCAHALQRYVVMALAGVTGMLGVVHAGYACMVNHLSEGRVQQRFDAAFDEMLRYAAQHTSLSGTVAFIQDPQQREAIGGIPILLRMLYKRPDIVCVFPTQNMVAVDAELICAPYRMGPLNYFRLPASEHEGWCFIQQAETNSALSEVQRISYTTEIWYATTRFGEPQYRSSWGIPAWWKLQRGTYEFGWRVYIPTPATTNRSTHAREMLRQERNLLHNAAFDEGLRSWRYWGAAAVQTSRVTVMATGQAAPLRNIVRICTEAGQLSGVSQTVAVRSGTTYRLSAMVRSLVTNTASVGFGARVAVFLPPQPEVQLVWMSEYNNWWRRELIFTNMVDGTATVYAHMGFGGFGSTGDFAEMRLEQEE